MGHARRGVRTLCKKCLYLDILGCMGKKCRRVPPKGYKRNHTLDVSETRRGLYNKEGYESMRHNLFLVKNMDLIVPQQSLSGLWICFEGPSSSSLDLLPECVREAAIELSMIQIFFCSTDFKTLYRSPRVTVSYFWLKF